MGNSLTPESEIEDSPSLKEKLDKDFYPCIRMGYRIISAWPVQTKYDGDQIMTGLALTELKAPHEDDEASIDEKEISRILAVISFKTVHSIDVVLKWLQIVKQGMIDRELINHE